MTPSPESIPVELSDVDTPPPSQNRPRASGKTPATTVVGRNTTLGVPLSSVPPLLDTKTLPASLVVAPASVPSSSQKTIVGTIGQNAVTVATPAAPIVVA